MNPNCRSAPIGPKNIWNQRHRCSVPWTIIAWLVLRPLFWGLRQVGEAWWRAFPFGSASQWRVSALSLLHTQGGSFSGQGSAHGKVDLLLSRWPYSMTSYLLSSCLWHIFLVENPNFFWLKTMGFLCYFYDPVVNRITQPRSFQPVLTVGWSTGWHPFAAKKWWRLLLKLWHITVIANHCPGYCMG